MNHRNIIGMLILFVMVLVLSSVTFIATAQTTTNVIWETYCDGTEVSVSKLDAGFLVKCIGEVLSPTPTATLEPLPTNTPVPSPIEPYPTAPLCSTHDELEYHGLWNSELGCHYDHEHGDNPHVLDAEFGVELYSLMGGSISYPWSTSGENVIDHKHETYKWFVEENLPCNSLYTIGCITDFRALAHMDGHNIVSNYHSFVIEARVCLEANPSDCGFLRVGGWQFVGDLLIDGITVYDRDERTYAPNAPRPLFLYHDQVGNSQFASWYPTSPYGWARVATEFGDSWGYFSHSDPITDLNQLVWNPFCYDPGTENVFPGCRMNNSNRKPEIISVTVTPRNLIQIGQSGNAYANFNGFLDVYGVVNPTCLEVSSTCAPLTLMNVPASIDFQFNGSYTDHDIYFNGVPSGWIDFPN